MNKLSDTAGLRKTGLELSNKFSQLEGRQPRVVVSNFSTTSINHLCNVLADMGFDVDIAPKLDTMEFLVKQCVENDTDVLLIYLDSCEFEAELLRLKQQLFSENIQILLSLYLQDIACLSSLKTQFKDCFIYDQTKKEVSFAYQLLKALIPGINQT